MGIAENASRIDLFDAVIVRDKLITRLKGALQAIVKRTWCPVAREIAGTALKEQ